MRPAFPSRAKISKRRMAVERGGVALVLVSAGLMLLGAMKIMFGARVSAEYEAAENGRDEMRAHYLAISGINLSRLVIKVQNSILDKLRNQIGDVQIAEFLPIIMRGFAGSKDEIDSLVSLAGDIDTSKVSGLGLGRNQDFSVELDTDDGKINVNCAGGSLSSQQQLAGRLFNLFASPSYDHLFALDSPDRSRTDRVTVVNAILDYIDTDNALYGGNGNTENYDPRAKDNFIDSVEDLRFVKGIGDEFMATFGESLTVYGECQPNLNAMTAKDAVQFAALIVGAAKNPNDPVLKNPLLFRELLSAVVQVREMGSSFTPKSFADTVKNPDAALANPQGGMLSQLLGSFMGGGSASATGATTPPTGAPKILGVELDEARLGTLVKEGPRRTYRVVASGQVNRVRKRINALFDTKTINQNNTDPAYRTGNWVYWREE